MWELVKRIGWEHPKLQVTWRRPSPSRRVFVDKSCWYNDTITKFSPLDGFLTIGASLMHFTHWSSSRNVCLEVFRTACFLLQRILLSLEEAYPVLMQEKFARYRTAMIQEAKIINYRIQSHSFPYHWITKAAFVSCLVLPKFLNINMHVLALSGPEFCSSSIQDSSRVMYD